MFEHFQTKLKIVVNAVLLILGIGAYLGLWIGTGSLLEKTIATRAVVLQSDTSEEKTRAVRKLVTERGSDIAKVEGYVLNDSDIVSFIEYIEDLGREAGVQVSTDRVSAGIFSGVNAEKWSGFSLMLETEGSWEATYRFSMLLERIPYRSEVLQASIEVVDAEKDGHSWQGSFSLNVLKQKKK
ncbi:MAG TPA: hypothetical protein VJH94_02830 [Candidatus Paceibacterota bacterium]